MAEMSKIDKLYIERRANEWVKKVKTLYSFVKFALTSYKEIEYKSTNNVVMYEELMEKFGVLPKNVPIFDLYVDKQLIATFKPIGLWVLGSKGRIDILTKSGAFILVDVAKNQSEWKVYPPENRKKGESFDKKFIDKLVSSQ